MLAVDRYEGGGVGGVRRVRRGRRTMGSGRRGGGVEGGVGWEGEGCAHSLVHGERSPLLYCSISKVLVTNQVRNSSSPIYHKLVTLLTNAQVGLVCSLKTRRDVYWPALNNKLKKTANINTKKLSSLQRKLMTKNDTSKTANMKWDGSV
jgi:hypothetical protein